jgi:hypothetical protein
VIQGPAAYLHVFAEFTDFTHLAHILLI